MNGSRRSSLLALALALLALTLAVHQSRRGFIRAFFAPARGGAPPPVLGAPATLPGAPAPDTPAAPVHRVRVVLIDGVGKDTAAALPHYSALCRDGLDLTVDTGFPTVSLPVQHTLWTGLTQQQSGILFRGKAEIQAHPLPPPGHGIPAQVPDSLAVAESHPYIVHALGFHEVQPASATELPPGWAEGGFLRAAQDAVASDRRLVFVHILRVDVAGHRAGRDADAYREAVRQADAMLGALVAAERAAHDDHETRWLILSDHGHRGRARYGPAGGHGGAEPAIRQVLGCMAGAGLPAAGGPGGGYVHLADVSRFLADALGVRLAPEAAGRPLAHALRARVHPHATLPRPTPARWLVAALLMLLAVAATVAAAGPGGRATRLPWWWPVALASVLLIAGMPSLSVPMVYQPLGRVIYTSALPGLALLAVTAALSLRTRSALRVVIAQMAVPVAALLGAAVLAGGASGIGPLLGIPAGEPPLMPRWSAMTSVLAVLVYAGAGVCALALALAIAALRPAQHR